jgi:magnesium chelatase family protein
MPLAATWRWANSGSTAGWRRPTGVLPAAIAARGARLGIICPEPSGPEAAWAGEDIDIIAPESLLALVNHLGGYQLCAAAAPPRGASTGLPDLSEVRGQEVARRALEVAAAGGHNLLMIGPPGAGKSMLAQRLPSILPPLNPRELLDVSMIQSIAGELAGGALSDRRPFRAPHHSASMAALVGGGLRSGRARSAWPTTACCSSTNCPSSSPPCSTVCASRSKAARR